MKRGKARIALTVALAASLASGGYAPAFSPEARAEVPTAGRFADVPETHWAAKHIAKLALQGVVEGTGVGVYSPDAPVNRAEVLIMLVRMLGLKDEALQSGTEAVLPFGVQDYARNYVAVAASRRWIDVGYEHEVSVREAGKVWGIQPASREWVARTVLRAFGKQADAEAKATAGGTVFRDDADIAPEYLGYVRLAAELGIVTGFEDGRFLPKKEITRAQMAAILSRSEKWSPVRHPDVLEGVAVRWAGGSLQIYTPNGIREIAVADDVPLFGAGADTVRLDRSAFSPGYPVYAIVRDGKALYLERTADRPDVRIFEGRVASLDLAALTVDLDIDGKIQHFELDGRFTATDAEGRGVDLGSVAPGSIVELQQLNIPGAKPFRLVVKRLSERRTVQAAFVSIDSGRSRITVRTATGTTETFEMVENVPIFLKDQPVSADQLLPGDPLQLETVDGIVRRIDVVLQTAEEWSIGTFVGLVRDGGEQLVTVRGANGEYATRPAAEGAAVFWNETSLSLSELIPGDELRLEIGGGKIVAVRVLKRNIRTYYGASVVVYDEPTKTLTLTLPDGKPAAFRLDDSVELVADGSAVPLSMFSAVFPRGKRVDVTVASGDRILRVRLGSVYSGVLYRLDTQSKQLTVQVAGGDFVTLRIADVPVVLVPLKNPAGIADLRLGDRIEVRLNAAQDRVEWITVRRDVPMRISAVDAAGGKLTATDWTTGVSATYAISSSVTVERKGVGAVRLNAVSTGETAWFRFFGPQLEKVVLTEAVRGQVRAVDVATGKLTVVDADSAERTLTAAGTVEVYRGGAAIGLGGLSSGDRVEILQDDAGNLVVAVYVREARVFSSYDAATRTVRLKLRSTNDQGVYTLHPRAYVHSGTTRLDPAQLRDGDAVDVYVRHGEILEIEKKP